MKLLLFDIDGTLIATGGAGQHAFLRTTQEIMGFDDDLATVPFHGQTDTSITARILKNNGVEPTEEKIDAFLDAYLGFLEEELPRCQGALLPGVRELLDELHEDERFFVGLLTGNTRTGAQLKLTYYGIWEYFNVGAFGDDHHHRNELPAYAHRRALDVRGVNFAPEQIYVIGDTPKDIECGKAFGANTLAVATGGTSLAELLEHKPTHALEDFVDTAAILRLLGQ